MGIATCESLNKANSAASTTQWSLQDGKRERSPCTPPTNTPHHRIHSLGFLGAAAAALPPFEAADAIGGSGSACLSAVGHEDEEHTMVSRETDHARHFSVVLRCKAMRKTGGK